MKLSGAVSVVLFVFLVIPAVVSAAEIRGKFSAYQDSGIPAGTKINVTCGNFNKPGTLRPNGSYSIRGLPASRGCSYQVKYADGAKSAEIPFNSGNGVVRINGKLRKHGNTMIIISK